MATAAERAQQVKMDNAFSKAYKVKAAKRNLGYTSSFVDNNYNSVNTTSVNQNAIGNSPYTDIMKNRTAAFNSEIEGNTQAYFNNSDPTSTSFTPDTPIGMTNFNKAQVGLGIGQLGLGMWAADKANNIAKGNLKANKIAYNATATQYNNELGIRQAALDRVNASLGQIDSNGNTVGYYNAGTEIAKRKV